MPVLIDGQIAVWESLAILDYFAEKFPKLALWPADPAARAHARAISAEMHAGFAALRQACPMNLKRVPRPIVMPPEAERRCRAGHADLERRARAFRQGRQFPVRRFSAADCMYAPVATRIRTYSIPVDLVSSAYVDAIHALPAFVAWREAGLKEPWMLQPTIISDDADARIVSTREAEGDSARAPTRIRHSSYARLANSA